MGDPNVVEVENVFGEGEAESNDNEEFDSVVDVFDFAVVDGLDGKHFHQFLDDANKHEGDDNAEWQSNHAGKTDEVTAIAISEGKSVDPWEKLPKEFVDENGKNG